MLAIKKKLQVIITLSLISSHLSANNSWADYISMIVPYGQKIFEKRELLYVVGFGGWLGYREWCEKKQKEQKELKKKEKAENSKKSTETISKVASISEKLQNLESRVNTLENNSLTTEEINSEKVELKNLKDAIEKIQTSHQNLQNQANDSSEKIRLHSQGILLLAKNQLAIKNQVKGLSEIIKLNNDKVYRGIIAARTITAQSSPTPNSNGLTTKTHNHTLEN